MPFCEWCSAEISSDARFCSRCGGEVIRARSKPPVPVPPAPEPAPRRQGSGVPWVIAGMVVGLLGGLLAVHLTDQALCPHAILGPCSALTTKGRTGIVIAGVVVGAFLGALISGSRRSR